MTNPTGLSQYSLFPTPEEQKNPRHYPLSGIILKDQAYAEQIRKEIDSLQMPDDVIWEVIRIRESEPGTLTTLLLQQAYKVQSLNRWAQSKIPLEWLSRDNHVGKASRMLLEQEFDESRFQEWLKTKPSNGLISVVLNSDSLKGRQYADETLKLLSKVRLDFLTAQSLTHFPWLRLTSLDAQKRRNYVNAIRKQLASENPIPSGLLAAAEQANATRSRMLFITLCVGIPKPELIKATSALLEKELTVSKVPLEILQQHAQTMLACAELSTEELQQVKRLLWHPNIQWPEKELKALFDLFLDRLFTHFTAMPILMRRALHLHTALALSLNSEPQENPRQEQARKIHFAADYHFNANRIVESAIEVMLTYTQDNHWINFTSFLERIEGFQFKLSAATIALDFDEKRHFFLLKSYISKLCKFQTAFEPMQWIISLFAVHTLHHFSSAHRSESAFVDSMLEEIFLRSPQEKNLHQGSLERALYELPEERALDAPRIRLLHELRLMSPQAPAITPAKLLSILERLLLNPGIGAVNEALHLCKTYQDSMKQEVLSPIRALIADRIKNHLNDTLKTDDQFSSFCQKFPELALFALKSLSSIPVEKADLLRKSFIEVMQRTLDKKTALTAREHCVDLKLVLNGLECLRSTIGQDPLIQKLLEDLGKDLFYFLMQMWKKIQHFNDPVKLDQTIEMCRRLLRTLPLTDYQPELACDIWLSVRIILIRKLLTEPGNQAVNEKRLIAFYTESKPAQFHKTPKEYRERVEEQFCEFSGLYSKAVVSTHERFIKEIHPPVDPKEFRPQIDTLSAPDDALIHAIMNSKDEPSLLQLAQQVSKLTQPRLLGWLLGHVYQRLSGTDELGALLRASCKEAPVDLEIEGYLLEWIRSGPSLPHLLEALSVRYYSGLLLETLRQLLYSRSSNASTRTRFYEIFLIQNLDYFPWGWCAQQMPAQETLEPLAKKLQRKNVLPSTLTPYLAKSAALKNWLQQIHHPYLILSELTQLEADFKKYAKKPPIDRCKDSINRLLTDPRPSFAALDSAFRLLLHPASLKMNGHLALFQQLLDRAFQMILIPHREFREICRKLSGLNDNFKYDENNSEVEPFKYQPSKQISLQQIYIDAEQTFLHYYLPNMSMPKEVKDQCKNSLINVPPEGPTESFAIEFNPNIHDELEWIFVKTLLALRPETPEERFLLNFYARTWLHQYALNHGIQHRERLVWANDQIYFLSRLAPDGFIDLESVAHTSFPIERKLFRKSPGGMLERQHLIQGLVTAQSVELEEADYEHTDQLHKIFMQLIRTATPDALEAVERIRHDINLITMNDKHWDEETEETNQAFKQSIVPLMRDDNIPALFAQRPFLLQLAVTHAPQFAAPLIDLIHGQVDQCPVSRLVNSLKQIHQLGQARPEIKPSAGYLKCVTAIARKMISGVHNEFEIIRTFQTLVHSSPALAEVSSRLFAQAYIILTTALVTKALDPKPTIAMQWSKILHDHLDKAKLDLLKSSLDSILPKLEELAQKCAEAPAIQEKFKSLMSQLKA